jgi:hypothetical protein
MTVSVSAGTLQLCKMSARSCIGNLTVCASAPSRTPPRIDCISCYIFCMQDLESKLLLSQSCLLTCITANLFDRDPAGTGFSCGMHAVAQREMDAQQRQADAEQGQLRGTHALEMKRLQHQVRCALR